MYNNILNIISDIDIPNGNTKRMNCPNCNGYKTFTVTNNMGSLVWNCYKASCGIKGGTRVHLTVDDIRAGFSGADDFASQETFTLPEYIVPANFDVAEWAMELYGLDHEELGLMYDVKEQRAVFPVRHGTKIVDATGRALTHRLPKWKRYGNSGLPYIHGYGKVAVVVEDCVSAAVVGNDVWCPGVANGEKRPSILCSLADTSWPTLPARNKNESHCNALPPKPSLYAKPFSPTQRGPLPQMD